MNRAQPKPFRRNDRIMGSLKTRKWWAGEKCLPDFPKLSSLGALSYRPILPIARVNDCEAPDTMALMIAEPPHLLPMLASPSPPFEDRACRFEIKWDAVAYGSRRLWCRSSLTAPLSP